MHDPTDEEIWYALVESIKLQSHYARLLNQHDGGARMTFADPNAWIERVRQTMSSISYEPCVHATVERGKDVPRLYGSWRTQVCVDCKAFRTHGHDDVPDPSKPWGGHPWRPAGEYASATRPRGDDE